MMILGTEWLDIRAFPPIGDQQAFHFWSPSMICSALSNNFSSLLAVIRC